MNYLKPITLLTLLAIMVFTTGCGDDDEVMVVSNNFTVTIENTFVGNDFFTNGVTGVIMPGTSESISFNAGKGHNLSFATMYVQSNDVFFGAGENGIALYDANGNATTGNVTSMISLWDAGTEVNEAPGEGMNQAPRQSGPNTGETENSPVRLLSMVNDGFTYPEASELIEVNIMHDGGTMFTITLKNISNNSAIASPFAPGTWVVNSATQTPLFAAGNTASMGLERIAEDGNNEAMNNNISSRSGLVGPFAPGAYGVNDAVFTVGQAASGPLEALAEDGNSSGFTNVFNTPVGASDPGPIFPGSSYSFSFSAEEGSILSFATMMVQSNDWFIGANDIDLFANGVPKSGDLTAMLSLYDAGTETDEYAGAGNNQAPRQSGANMGAPENGNVMLESSAGAHVPSVANMIKVTLAAN
ncbi:MAG: spondin domain-containing protein [Saprospiraceae bacterium]